MPFDERRIPEHEIDPEYQTFKMQDFDGRPDNPPLLTQIEYLVEMFDLQVQNERGKPIVITLTEKAAHFEHRNGKHQHEWAVDSSFPTHDTNPPSRVVRCACGATAYRQDRTMRIFDITEPN